MAAEVIWTHDTQPITPWGSSDDKYGTAIVITAPESGAEDALPAVILSALGKPRNALRHERIRKHGWPIARAWLHGHEIETIVVLAAHRLDTSEVSMLTQDCGAVDTVALVYPTPPDHNTLNTLQLKAPTATHRVAATARRCRSLYADRCTRIESLELPTSSFLTFRADARRYLPPAVYKTVNHEYLSAYRQVHHRLMTHHTGYGEPLDITVSDVTDIIDSLLEDIPDQATRTIRAKAAQAAFFRQRILLRFPNRPSHPYTDHKLAAGILDRLTTIATPPVATAAALTVAARGRLDILVRLRIGDHHPAEGTLNTPNADPIIVPNVARPVLAAHISLRTASGAHQTDPLFTTPSGDRATRGSIRGLLRRAERFAGVTVLHPGYVDTEPWPFLTDHPTVLSLHEEPAWPRW